MKKNTILFIITLVLTSTALAASTMKSGKTFLSGKITDKETGESLAGVSIYIPDLKTGATSGKDGTYKIENLPQTIILLQVSIIGYQTIIETIDLSTTNTKNFILEPSVKEMNEIVITGTSQATEKNRTPTPITVISKITLLQNSSGNIIDAVATQPGVSQVTTGAGISKPVIRGLGTNRVVVVNDGIRQEGQQWGDEHGVEIDEFSIDKVEILKGPASLVYGSDAMAGVINMISSPTLPVGTVKGNIFGNYQTNNSLIGYSGNLAGNMKGFIWDVRYSNKMAHSYQNKYDQYVYNSGFKETNISGIAGVNKSWGYSHLHFSAYHLVPGIVDGTRDSTSGKFIKRFALNDSTEIDTIVPLSEIKSYKIDIPYQDIHHYKAVINNSFIIKNGILKAILGYQQNHRQEFNDVLKPDTYGLYLLLNTINYDTRYIFSEENKWQTSLGVNGMYQQSQNKGTEFLIPEYTLFDIGGFIMAKKSFEISDVSAGIRYDTRKIEGSELLLDTSGIPSAGDNLFHIIKFKEFNRSFSNISGSLGATYQISDKVFSKLNVSRGFRAPNIAELGANGEHEGSGRYEIGNPALKAEKSLQIDFAIGLNTMHVSAEADVFSNGIGNFIYIQKLNSILGGDSIINPADPIPAFRFIQGNANLFGGEAIIDIHPHPLDWLHFENSFSFVWAVQKNATDSTKYMPFIPSPKLSSDLRADFKKAGKVLLNAYFKIGLENYFGKEKFYSAFGTETRTPQYVLINCGAGTDFVSKGNTICSLYFSINNLTDVAYQSHLSRLKYVGENYATGRTGVYNMGRNISVKLFFPINIKKRRENLNLNLF